MHSKKEGSTIRAGAPRTHKRSEKVEGGAFQGRKGIRGLLHKPFRSAERC